MSGIPIEHAPNIQSVAMPNMLTITPDMPISLFHICSMRHSRSQDAVEPLMVGQLKSPIGNDISWDMPLDTDVIVTLRSATSGATKNQRVNALQASSSAPVEIDHLPSGPIILFDAECILCSANAYFVLKHDKSAHFHLASMQGPVGAMLFRRHGVDPGDPSTIIVVDGVHVRKNSDAVLSIYEGLGFPWRLATMFRIIPASMRDLIYGWIARNRYRIFGKRQTCWIPPEKFRARVL